MIEFSFDEFKELSDNYCGVCLNCGEIADNVEPDASCYECYFCGRNKVCGLELALISGDITIKQESNP